MTGVNRAGDEVMIAMKRIFGYYNNEQ